MRKSIPGFTHFATRYFYFITLIFSRQELIIKLLYINLLSVYYKPYSLNILPTFTAVSYTHLFPH